MLRWTGFLDVFDRSTNILLQSGSNYLMGVISMIGVTGLVLDSVRRGAILAWTH